MGLQALMFFSHSFTIYTHSHSSEFKKSVSLVFVDGRINEERVDNSLEARPPGGDGYAGSRPLSQQFSVSLATSLAMSFSTSHVRHCRGKIKQTTPIHTLHASWYYLLHKHPMQEFLLSNYFLSNVHIICVDICSSCSKTYCYPTSLN